jgi:hypothetical protein
MDLFNLMYQGVKLNRTPMTAAEASDLQGRCIMNHGYRAEIVKIDPLEGLNGVEKVLYNSTLKFALEVLNLPTEEATKMAEDKISQKRNLGKSLNFKY